MWQIRRILARFSNCGGMSSIVSKACRRGQAQFKERKACVAPAASTRKCSSLLVKSHEHPAWGTRHHRCTTYGIYDFARFVQTLERARVTGLVETRVFSFVGVWVFLVVVLMDRRVPLE